MSKPPINISHLRSAISEGQIQWQRHALERMLERGISRVEVVEALLHGNCIEDYPEDLPLPSALVFGWTEIRPLHVVVAYSEERSMVSIITV